MKIKLFSIIVLIAFLASCAPKKEVVKPEPTPPQAPIENLVLPEITPQEPTPPQKKPEPIRVEQEKDEKYIILNFDGADIETVLSSFGELLGINYILTPGISGKVTIQSYKKFPVKDLPRIFQTILEVNGLTAIKDGSFYRVVPIDTAKLQPLEVEKGKEVSHKIDSGFVTQLVPLSYVKASEIANILRSLAPRGTDIIVYEPTNLLIVTALPGTLAKFMRLIEAIDISEAERESLKTFVYYVENGEAKKLAEILKTIYAEKKGTPKTPVTPPTTQRPATPTTPTAGVEALPAEVGEITITAYEDINALIIQCSTRSYLALLEVLKKIDVPPKQVLIEVLIAEVSLGDSDKYGLEWLLTSKSGNKFGFTTGGTPTTVGVPSGSPVFSAIVSTSIEGAMLNYVFSAISTTSKVNIIASPHILAMDNKEANIHIGKETPIITSTQQQTTGGAPLVQQIQYKTVGTILSVKPHITEKNRVTLDITQEVSDIGKESAAGGSPEFTTRKAKTVAVVQSGHTLILGGLISESKKRSREGIPFLSKIPLLGYLFSKTSDSYDKTELLLMVTPHVISDEKDIENITKDFQEKVKTIKERLSETEKKPSKTE